MQECRLISSRTSYGIYSVSDEDLNKRLNLNCRSIDLKNCRLEALRSMQRKINQRYYGKTAPKEYFRKLLAFYQEQGEKTPYCGILIAWLKKKV